MHFSEGLGDSATPNTGRGGATGQGDGWTDSKHCTEIISRGMHKGTHGSDSMGSALQFRDAPCNI